MVLFFSDMHFGRGDRDVERAKEEALIECLQSHASEVDHLYLVGDVFDGYIEYDHLVPKGFVRFQALLADWTDRGIPVTYLLGNHDPWHVDHFPAELGVSLVSEACTVTHDGCRLHLAHGDAYASAHRLFSWVRPLLRSALAIRLYRSVLPADLGYGLANRVSKLLHDDSPDSAVIDALRTHARDYLGRHDVDAVLMGHSHVPVLKEWRSGLYVNIGNWYEDRTFVRLEEQELSLARWNGTRALDIEAAKL